MVPYRPVHGLIFLFRWIGEDQPDGPIVKDSRIDKIFFAQQVSSNALELCWSRSFIYIFISNLKLNTIRIYCHLLSKVYNFQCYRFCFQVINNACATQAILSVLFNCRHPDIDLGSTLNEFKEFSQKFDANMKGLALSNSQKIRTVHNSFGRYYVRLLFIINVYK